MLLDLHLSASQRQLWGAHLFNKDILLKERLPQSWQSVMSAASCSPPTMQSWLTAVDLKKEHDIFILCYFTSIGRFHQFGGNIQFSWGPHIEACLCIAVNADKPMGFLCKEDHLFGMTWCLWFAYAASWHASWIWPYNWPWNWLTLTVMDVPEDLFLSSKNWVLGYGEHKNLFRKVGLANLCFQIILP